MSEAAMTQGEDDAKSLEQVVERIHDALPGDGWSKRIHIAWLTGSLDAKHMVYMMQTFGFPLWAYVDCARKKFSGIGIPWMMLEHELLCIGKNKASIQSLFKEMQYQPTGARP